MLVGGNKTLSSSNRRSDHFTLWLSQRKRGDDVYTNECSF